MNNDLKPKITFIIESLEGGGAERVTSILTNKFFDVGLDVNLIILYKKENEYPINKKIKKYYPTLNKSYFKIFRVLNRMYQVNKLISKLDSEIIISLSMPETNMLLVPSLISKSKRVILSERNDPKNFPKSKIIKGVRSILYMLADNIVFQTNEAKEYFSNLIQSKGSIIPNPIKEDLPQRFLGKRNKEIINFCRLDTQKNLPMLIDAYEKIYQEYPDYSLSIYGKGPLETELKDYANQKDIGVQKIKFKGHTDNIHNEILESAMFVSSSNYEGISNSMLESLAIGIPTISTDCPVGGARMFIKPFQNGILVPVGDTIALYKAMKEIIMNDELSEKLSQNAVGIREELSVDRVAAKWMCIIEKYAMPQRGN
jgi:GalNAc-alpha-(1->4)-GalNAc-alpha-(1->3)-diNAcBac-PP-undecaprenol alpha-1,4-N-acetyl-D-galactosaminyltransferase